MSLFFKGIVSESEAISEVVKFAIEDMHYFTDRYDGRVYVEIGLDGLIRFLAPDDAREQGLVE